MVYKLFFLTLAVVLAFPQISYAQRGGQQQNEVKINLDSTSLFPRNLYTLAFFSDARESESNFTMRFQAYGVVAGCAAMKKGRVPRAEKDMYKDIKDGAQVEYLNQTLKVSIVDTEIKVNKRAPRYSLHDCDIKHNTSYIDIPLNRDDLIRRKINKLRLLSVNYGDFGEHEIDIDENRFILKVDNVVGEYWATYWFFPENSVALYTPEAKQGENVTESIREFGISHGLIPMEEVLEGFTLPHTAQHHVYFTDPRRRFIGQLEDIGQSVSVGSVKAARTVYGTAGAHEESYNLNVSAMLPVQEQPE